MKIGEKKILCVLIIMFLSSLFNTYFIHLFEYVNLYYLLFWGFSLGLSILMLGYKKDRYAYKLDSIQIIFIYCFIYLIVVYLSGLFLGFVRSPYNLNIIKIARNIFPIASIILIQELFRYNILKNTKNKFVIIFLFIIFVTFNISLNFQFYSTNTAMDIFEIIAVLVLPTIAINSLLTYISYKGTFKVSIIYRLIFELYIFVIPIVPDLGIYFESILGIVFPMLIFLRFNSMFAKDKPVNRKKSKLINIFVTTPILLTLIVIVALSSNVFSHSTLAIGSNSMYPTIKKGDVVIVEKINKQYEKLELNDILVYSHNKKIIIHRITSIKHDNTKYIFNTKGDNNDTVDNYNIEEADVIGRVEMIIPYIGHPSVWLSEQVD